MNFDDLRDGYAELWKSLVIRPEWSKRVNDAAAGLLRDKAQYHPVSNATGVPWFVIGLIHQMESDRKFGTHLHNGNSLKQRTTDVPAGRPAQGEPPFTWAESAIDAVRYDKLDAVPAWSCERIAFELEKYNGFRSRTVHKINTPYLWSGTTHYVRGKFVRDHVWSDTAVSEQVGAMPILRRLMELDATIAPALSAPPIEDVAVAVPTPDVALQSGLDLTELQSRLGKLPLYPVPPDGRYGAKTEAAIRGFLLARGVTDWAAWRGPRLVIAGQQALCALDGIDVGEIDGILGPQTQYALEVYAAKKNGKPLPDSWREERENDPPVAEPPPKAADWPRQAQVPAFYGELGQNQIRLQFPYPMRIAWNLNQVVTSTLCHIKVHDAAKRALQSALDHYGIDKIRALRLDLFGGCLNVRKMRGGSSWSMHSWGIAFDFDPERNQLNWGRDRATFGRQEYVKWFECWESEGAVSLGRTRNYDWMHVQFARL